MLRRRGGEYTRGLEKENGFLFMSRETEVPYGQNIFYKSDSVSRGGHHTGRKDEQTRQGARTTFRDSDGSNIYAGGAKARGRPSGLA